MRVEKAVLGTLLKENYLLDDTILTAGHFQSTEHYNLFNAIKQLRESNKVIDLISIPSHINPKEIGGVSYLVELMSFSNVEKFEAYQEIIHDKWKHKEKRNILNNALENDDTAEIVIKKLDDLLESKLDDHSSISEQLSKLYEAPYEKKEFKVGAMTGIKELDLMTNGLQDSELIILAARPSMGKSDAMLQVAKTSGYQGYIPIIFSLEMSAESLTQRLIGSEGKYNRAKLRNPEQLLSNEQKKRWSSVIGRIDDTKIQIFDRSGQKLSEIRSKTRKIMNQFPDKKPIVFIDYLTLIKPAEKGNNMHLQVSEITKGLKAMAKEFTCPVVALAQLSRGLEQRENKRPMSSDLRESGSIEEDADVIIMLYRDAYYSKKEDDRSMEFIVTKHRNGPTGTIITTYNKNTGEIEG
jgi:replicative DNA helicase